MPAAMKLFALSTSLPYPLTDGGKIRVFNLLRQLARTHSVRLAALETEPTDRDSIQPLKEAGIDARLIPLGDPNPPSLTPVSAARSLLRGMPLAVSKYQLKPMRRALAEELAKPFDLLLFEMMHTAPYLPSARRLSNAPALLSTQNVDSEVWDRAAERQKSRLRRAAYRWQANVFRRTERRLCPKFDALAAVSERDADALRQHAPNALAAAIDNGVDLDAYRPSFDKERPATFVYTGSYDWEPNADAAAYFCADIWPRIRAALPNAQFRAVGKRPTAAMLALHGQNGIVVTGRVDDIQEHIAQASVFAVPLRMGGGTRLKILEAMAMEKAVVSTTIGAEGLEVKNGRDLELADDPGAFADAAVRLATDANARRALGSAARKRVEERYGWEAIGAKMRAFCERVAGQV